MSISWNGRSCKWEEDTQMGIKGGRKTKKDCKTILFCSLFSEPEEARTPDTWIKSPVLYRLSYRPTRLACQ